MPTPKINIKIVNNVLRFTIFSSPKEEQSYVTDTVMKLVCVWTQATVVWPWAHTHTHTHTHDTQNSAFEQSIANTNNKTYLQSLIQKRQIVWAKSELPPLLGSRNSRP